MRTFTKEAGLRTAGLAILALALVHHGRTAVDRLDRAFGDPRPRAPFALAQDAIRLAEIRPEGVEGGLAEGDVPVAIGSRPYVGLATLQDAMRDLAPGEALPVEVERDGRRLATEVRLVPETGSRPFVWLFLSVAMPLFGTALGAWTVLVRPTDRRAWILFGMLLGFGQFLQGGVLSWEPALRTFGAAWHALLDESWPIFMLLFGLEFPQPFPWERRRPWLKAIPIALLAAAAAVRTVYEVGLVSDQRAGLALVPLVRAASGPSVVLEMLAIGSFFAFLAIKAARAQSPDARRRLRILRWGTTAALTPLFLLVIWSLLHGTYLEEAPGWAFLGSLLVLPLFPATLAYVIVVERALDVRLALRMGARYLLVKSGLRLLIFLVMLPVGMGVGWALGFSGWPAPARVAIGAAYLVLIVFVRRRATRGMKAIDRRYFREVYDEEQILGEVGETVRTIVDERELLDTVTRALETSLHVHPVTVLGDDDLPAGGRLAPALLRAGRPLGVYVDDPASWIFGTNGLPEGERDRLCSLRAQVLLPLLARGRLLGAIALGPKRSEQAFTGTDLRLLRNVAAQTGLALENSRLTAAIAAESARRARMDRELEIARQVQEGLFPKEAPAVPGVDLAGHCRPAAGIGGDYYDYLALADGRLGLAIADVAGKGIPAALLMAGLQASLRGQRLHGGDLRELIARINRLVYDATPPNRYATFFYGEYDPATGVLQYVNAGHNPPVLLRRGDGAEPVLLQEGGMVVGLLPEAEFRTGTARLEPGDLLVAYTDGVSEAMNPADEEWGTERMIACARGADGAPARAVLERLMREATAFAGTAPQHDDMTLVVLRRVEEGEVRASNSTL